MPVGYETLLYGLQGKKRAATIANSDGLML